LNADFERVRRVENQTFQSNTYLVLSESGKDCLIVDPGLDPQIVDTEIQKYSLAPRAILSTHGHFDHMGGAHYFREKYNIPFYLPKADLKVAKAASFLLMACRIKAKVTTPPVDHLVEDDREWTESGFKFKFMAVPGHTPGSHFIQIDGHLFTGDSLYKKGVGLVHFPGENEAMLKDSLLKILPTLDEKLHVYPGHGGSGTWAEIKKINLKLHAFLGWASDAAEGESVDKKTLRGDDLLDAFKKEIL
jgi:glyoxylase-like metal-dependent hydrolase (beta-lactamase superfamily II)